MGSLNQLTTTFLLPDGGKECHKSPISSQKNCRFKKKTKKFCFSEQM